MDILESKVLRSVLLVVTIVALFVILQRCTSGSETATETSDEAAEEAIATSEMPELDLTVEPSPVVVQATTVPTEPTNVIVYTVQSGDTLNEIAIAWNVNIEAIRNANPSLDPARLQIGQKIKLPGAQLDPSALENPSTEREPGETITYYIESGDLLGTIASDYTVTLDALLAANPGVDAAAIQVGQAITVPPIGSGFAPEELTPVPTITPIPRALGEVVTVTVQSGDSLREIADAYGVSMDAVMGANDIQDADQIFVGQDLLIPAPPLE